MPRIKPRGHQPLLDIGKRQSAAGLGKQVIAALYRPGEHLSRRTVAVKPQQTKDSAGATADDVELLVRRNQVVAEQLAAPCASASKSSSSSNFAITANA